MRKTIATILAVLFSVGVASAGAFDDTTTRERPETGAHERPHKDRPDTGTTPGGPEKPETPKSPKPSASGGGGSDCALYEEIMVNNQITPRCAEYKQSQDQKFWLLHSFLVSGA